MSSAAMPQAGGIGRHLLGPLPIVGLFVIALAACHWSGSSYGVILLTRTAILALSAVSLSFLIGQAGLVSFGHAAPVGLGAYAALILGEYGISDAGLVFPAAIAVAAGFSVLTGAIALRTRGVYFIMITLAFAQMAFYVVASLAAFGGDDGMSLSARTTVAGLKLLKWDLNLAILAIALLGLALWLIERLCAARFGLVLRAARDNELKLTALGRDAYLHRLVALAFAGGLAGLAGVLLANQVEFVSPAYMNWHVSGEMIVMVVLGGTRRPGGAVAGAIAVALIDEILQHYTEHWKFGLGLVIVAAVLWRATDFKSLARRLAHG